MGVEWNQRNVTYFKCSVMLLYIKLRLTKIWTVNYKLHNGVWTPRVIGVRLGLLSHIALLLDSGPCPIIYEVCDLFSVVLTVWLLSIFPFVPSHSHYYYVKYRTHFHWMMLTSTHVVPVSHTLSPSSIDCIIYLYNISYQCSCLDAR